MPSFITHIQLSKKLREAHCPDSELTGIVQGSVFPDIRRMGVVKRSETHMRKLGVSRFHKAQNDFERGFLLHNFVDILFHKDVIFLEEIPQLARENDAHWLMGYVAMTLYLDRFFVEINGWNAKKNVLPALQEVPEDAFDLFPKINKEHLRLWQEKIADYTKNPPTSWDAAERLLTLWEYPERKISKVREMYKQVEGSERLQALFTEFRETVLHTAKSFFAEQQATVEY